MWNVLLVEDELLARSGMKAIVDWEGNGFHLVADVSHGQEALEIFRRHRVDIVLTDIRMPVMDGLALVQTIRKQELPCEVIVLSSYDDFQYVRQAMQLGVRDYIHKPTMTPAELVNTLKKVAEELDKKRSIEKYQQLITDVAGASREALLNKALKHIVTNGSAVLEPHITRMLHNAGIMDEALYLCVFRILSHRGSGSEYTPFLSEEETVHSFMRKHMEETDRSPVFLKEKNEWLLLSPACPAKTFHRFAQYADRFGWQLLWEVADQPGDVLQMHSVYERLSRELHERWEAAQRNMRCHPLILKALSYMHEHYMAPLTLEKVSRYIHVNPSYFSRLFYKETGKLFTDYLTSYRLERAQQLLLRTDLPVYEIAGRVGYSNSKYFLKVFKKQFSMTPGEFRRNSAEAEVNNVHLCPQKKKPSE
ncbi:response regulator [Paenactinomyces guangxiensis]|uniref:Response regulator transcription factor n=1 Tax=Paenactinomyces guangxiensis TaxID=1490290 RepID=A0A7W1WUV5_9BACL|nr:response regulator transcription factor [Paenactinomyces guangxiensis]MBA4496478.1 response regulator transcription factor [Paenactinomyces guangxiensis]MBH8593596.1 response regulator transcription factor [Paenactinomyces guangxiensis]